MTNEEKVEYWVKISDEDLKVAETMLINRHRLYTGFMCHQVIEKIFEQTKHIQQWTKEKILLKK